MPTAPLKEEDEKSSVLRSDENQMESGDEHVDQLAMQKLAEPSNYQATMGSFFIGHIT